MSKIKNKIRFFLEDVVDNRGKNPEQYFDDEKYPVIDNFLIENKIYPDLSKVKRYINQKTYDSFLRKYLEKDDVLITLVGNGFCSVSLSPSSNVVIIQNTIGLKTNQKLYNKFLYYYLLLQQKNLVKLNRSSSQPSLNQQDLLDYEIEIPEKLEDQQKIASVLSTLDGKIELNNKINTELEAMAKTLYDYWFVQFDFPDEKGKPYKSSGGNMVWSEELKREIPKEWKVKELGKFCEIYQPQTISEKEMLDDGKYYVFGANGVVGKYDQYNHENSEIVITCRGNTCGNITRTYPYSWITGNAMVVKPKDEKIHNEFVFCLLQNINIHKTITGSAQPQITRTNLSPVKILLPNENLLKKFSEQIKSNVKKRLQIVEENQKIAELRDFLLPMLMNGQVVVE